MEYESISGEDTRAWHFCLRQHSANQNRTSAVVLYDWKKSRASLPDKLRTRCTYFEGMSENRGVCVHESYVLSELSNRSRCIELTSTTEEDYHDGEMHTFEREAERESRVEIEAEDIFMSKQKRKFFAYASEETAVF